MNQLSILGISKIYWNTKLNLITKEILAKHQRQQNLKTCENLERMARRMEKRILEKEFCFKSSTTITAITREFRWTPRLFNWLFQIDVNSFVTKNIQRHYKNVKLRNGWFFENWFRTNLCIWTSRQWCAAERVCQVRSAQRKGAF